MIARLQARCLGSLVAIALGLSACNPPPSTTTVDTGPIADVGPLPQPVVSVAMGVVDLGCVGHATIPAPTTMVSGTLHVSEFLSMANITSNAIDVFTNDVLSRTFNTTMRVVRDAETGG